MSYYLIIGMTADLHNNLYNLSVTSSNLKNCKELEVIFSEAIEYIRINFSRSKKLFTADHIPRLLKWWQNKMVHSHVGQLTQSHYSLRAYKQAKLVKGGSSIRDHLYHVERQ